MPLDVTLSDKTLTGLAALRRNVPSDRGGVCLVEHLGADVDAARTSSSGRCPDCGRHDGHYQSCGSIAPTGSDAHHGHVTPARARYTCGQPYEPNVTHYHGDRRCEWIA